jgi:hypothetical protein
VAATNNRGPEESGGLQLLISFSQGNEIMQKVRLPQQADLDGTIQKYASSPYEINEGDPVCFGYWSKEEVLNFLKELLESERIGVKAFAAIGRAADLHVADLVFESELAQGAICVLLKKEIARRGGSDAVRGKNKTPMPSVKCSLQRVIAFASGNQTRLADMVEDAVLNIFDSKLNAKLMYLLLLHRKQVEQLENLLA